MSASQLRARRDRLVRNEGTGFKATANSHIDGTHEHTALLGHERPYSNAASNGSAIKRIVKKVAPTGILGTPWAVLKSSWINVLLVFVPIGMIAGVMEWPPIARFVLNFLGIVPLAALLSFATEELAATMGPSIGGLLNATFGNAIELIVCIIALVKGEIRLVQSSLIGSVLVNILFVLGGCFIAGGIRRGESKYDPTVASIMSALMTLSACALLVPAILYATLMQSEDGDTLDIMEVSRGTAIILLVIYFVYLYFQLKTHSGLFSDNDDDDDAQPAPEHYPSIQEEAQNDEPETKDGDTLGPWGALFTMVLAVVCVGFNAEFLVDSINPIVDSTPMSKTFIGIILVPIISNAAEHVTAVIVSWKGKMNLALLVDLGSGLQITLFITPVLVLVAWAMGQPLTLHFQLFESIIFFLSVMVVNFLIRGGTANYLEGCLCVGWYFIIALAFFYYKEPDYER